MTLRCELYKTLVKKKALLIILFLLAVKLCVLVSGVQSVPLSRYEERPFYKTAMTYLSGKLTDEKEEYILSLRDELSHNGERAADIMQKYSAGEITFEEYAAEISEVNKLQQEERTINELYSQYLTVKSDPERRFFTMQNGWNMLLGRGAPDFLLAVAVILACVPIFAFDKQTGMDYILRTCKKGRAALCASKLACGVILALACAMLFAAEETVFILVRYGLPNADFPVQSITQYLDSGYELSLFQLSLATLGNVALGCVIIAAITMLTACAAQNSLYAACLPLLAVLLPYFALSGIERYIPLLGFLMSTGYLQGLVRGENFTPEQQVISPAEYIACIVISAVAIAVMMCATCAKYLRVKMKFPRRSISLFVCVMLALSLSSCTNNIPEIDSGITFDATLDNITCEAGGKTFYIENNVLMLQDDETAVPVLRDCFDTTADVKQLFAYNDYVYVLCGSPFEYKILKVNSRDMSADTVYTDKQQTASQDSFLGLSPQYAERFEDIAVLECFFVSGKNIWLVYSDGIYTVKENSTGKNLVLKASVYNNMISCRGGKIYYTDTDLNECVYDTAK